MQEGELGQHPSRAPPALQTACYRHMDVPGKMPLFPVHPQIFTERRIIVSKLRFHDVWGWSGERGSNTAKPWAARMRSTTLRFLPRKPFGDHHPGPAGTAGGPQLCKGTSQKGFFSPLFLSPLGSSLFLHGNVTCAPLSLPPGLDPSLGRSKPV